MKFIHVEVVFAGEKTPSHVWVNGEAIDFITSDVADGTSHIVLRSGLALRVMRKAGVVAAWFAGSSSDPWGLP